MRTSKEKQLKLQYLQYGYLESGYYIRELKKPVA
jgi:hypothetical protein